MDRVTKIGGHDPITAVELVAAVALVIGGIYVLSPFLDVSIILSEAPTVVQTLGSTFGLIALGVSAVGIGFAQVWAIVTYRWRVRSIALFSHIMLRLYVAIAVIAAQGFFPMDWFSGFVIAMMLVVCYMVLRRKIKFLEGAKR